MLDGIVAKIVTTGKEKLKSIYDPTCGSASLLEIFNEEVENCLDVVASNPIAMEKLSSEILPVGRFKALIAGYCDDSA